MPPRADKLPFPQSLLAGFAHPDPNVVAAHTLCRTAENAIHLVQDRSPPGVYGEPQAEELTLIHIRILGHLLSQSRLLTEAAISAISSNILQGQRAEVDVASLNLLGESYKNDLIRPCEYLIILTGIDLSDAIVVAIEFANTKDNPPALRHVRLTRSPQSVLRKRNLARLSS